MPLPSAPRPLRVFLMGMMGSGKTTVGTALADRLGWPYWDNDQRLVDTTGEHVDELAALGREGLHDLEVEQAVAAAQEPAPLVAGIASSVIERRDVWPLLRASGWCVYLRARVETLVARVGSAQGRRPFLEGDPAGFIVSNLQARGPLYARLADLTVDVDDAPPNEIAAEIRAWLLLAA